MSNSQVFLLTPTFEVMSQPGTSTASNSEGIANGLVEDTNRLNGAPRRETNYEPRLIDRMVRSFVRTKISQKRYRFEFKGLDLDMAYITDRIIALGYPANNVEKQFRNSMVNTREILWRRHGTNHVKIFNLRGGFLYNPAKFDNNVIYMDMTDHHPPKLELMAPFCREAKEWLDQDPENVIAVHCKAGKGRTGVMICALLIYIQFYPKPRQVLDYYSIVRTMNNQGVTIPSQRRYIYYYAHLREKKLNYLPLRMQLIGVYIERPPKTSDGSKIKVVVANGSRVIFSPPKLTIKSREYIAEVDSWRPVSDNDVEDLERRQYVSKRAYRFMVPKSSPVFVEGDVRVDLLNAEKKLLSSDKKIGHVWFNTMFACGQSFVYGDKKDPYGFQCTSIGRERTMFSWETMMEDPDGQDRTVRNVWKIVEPAKLKEHTPEESLKRIYRDYGMTPPREEIARRLYKAHDTGIVNDVYKQRQLETGGAAYSPEGGNLNDTVGNGPFQIPLEHGEHVLTFPVYEMDRALKNKKLDNGMKMHVVLRCIDEKMAFESETYCQKTFENEEQARSGPVSSNMRNYAPTTPNPEAIGAEKMKKPVVRYALNGTYNGRAHESLNDARFKDSVSAQSDRWCRFYYKQRSDSESEYPPLEHTCPLTHETFVPNVPSSTSNPIHSETSKSKVQKKDSTGKGKKS
ncbi:unnamed protein product [Caenorhabditis brenneri]